MNVKRITAVIMSIMMVLAVFAAIPFTAHATRVGVWEYEIISGKCILTEYYGNQSYDYVSIPVKIDDIVVDDVYADFSGLPNFQYLYLYKECQMAELPSFRNSSNLKYIQVLNDDNSVYAYNTLPDSIKTITRSGLRGTSITQLNLNKVTLIDDWAFAENSNLTKIIIPERASICDGAFMKISSACTIDYNGPLSEWPANRYEYSPNIVINCTDGSCGWCGGTSADDKDYINWVMDTSGNMTIECYNGMYETELDKQVITSHSWDKSALKTVTLNHIYKIGQNEFQNCKKLQTVYLSNDITAIEDSAFSGCNSLGRIYYDGTDAQFANVQLASGWKNGAPSGLTISRHFNLNVSSSAGGSASANTSAPYSGDTVTLTATPDAGYRLKEWVVLSDNAAIQNNEFVMPEEDVQVKAIFESVNTPVVAAHNLTLNGDIGVNFYAIIPQATANDYAKLTVDGNTTVVPIDLNKYETDDSGNKLYEFTCEVAAAQIDEKITGNIYSGNLVSDDISYSVQDYFTEAQSDPETMGNRKLMRLISSLATYGYYANKYFGYYDNFTKHPLFDDTGLDDVDTDDMCSTEPVISSTADGLEYVGASLLLRSETALRHYFKLPEGKDISEYTFHVGNKLSTETLTPVEKDNKWYVEISDIPAADLNKGVYIAVTDASGSEVNTWYYSPINYARAVLLGYGPNNHQITEDLLNAVKALTVYANKAYIYFNNIEN